VQSCPRVKRRRCPEGTAVDVSGGCVMDGDPSGRLDPFCRSSGYRR
jgi:hypothetical protein